MKTYSIKNIKSFRDSGPIKIKPLTIFVGPNSSGKSSLLRFPVVLSQTLKKNFTSPLFLNGAMIDYGDFEDVVFGHEKNSALEFSFGVDGKKLLENYVEEGLERFGDIEEFWIDVTVRRVETLQVEKFCLFVDNKRVLGLECSDGICSFTMYYTDKIDDAMEFEMIELKNTMSFYNFFPQLKKSTKDAMGKSLEKLKSQSTLGVIDWLLRYTTSTDSIEELGQIFKKEQTKRNKNLFEGEKDKGIISEIIKIVHILMYSLQLDDNISAIHEYLSDYLGDILYIGPFRQAPERVYRFSENRMPNVGKWGEYSVPILAQAFKTNKKLVEQVSGWFEQTMNCGIRIDAIDGSLFKVLVENKESQNNRGENLIDVGYGVAQVLPIITQLYYDDYYSHIEPESSKRAKTYIIEQPELHLHPAAQSSLADLFVNKILQEPATTIMIETHSEHLLRKLQVLVADPDVSITHDDIAIYYVDKNQDGSSNVQQMQLNEKGQFTQKWPSGFFDKSYELAKELIRVSAKPQNS